MINTEKKYWVNGTHVRGKDFYTIAKSFRNHAIMISFSFSLKYFSINLYKLT